ncbi:lys-63-specific deubiquitinase BRCC36-like [Branchiostoma lanceolatum]|uniref:lys-63-specific deubiquitinase BRCC36-like n=1 Tax=Branchiostoma lanceolatum TaxID=7740 RepID=UPI0034542180
MSVSSVHLAADAYMVCLTHALSTEREEVMGLCIGEVDPSRTVHISAVIMLRRSDKRKDRVEISPEQLSAASTEAERLAVQLNRPMRVVGWYHSHPHITVWPSHVDVQTQQSYQFMDDCFVGLIFAVFNEDKATKRHQVQVTCFQSINQSPEGEPPMYERIEIPLHILPQDTMSRPCLESLVELPQIFSQEEQEAYSRTLGEGLDLTTCIHNGTVYMQSLSHLMEVLSGSLVQTLENRVQYNKNKVKRLKEEKEQLEKDIQEFHQKSQK